MFLLTLHDSGVRLLAADMPEANDLAVGITALVAQQEREAIAQGSAGGRKRKRDEARQLEPARRACGVLGGAMRPSETFLIEPCLVGEALTTAPVSVVMV